ncbi:MAG: hypothetical protein CM1200mP13_03750 [Candidatus Pelagibacterales bacterium]|nr:MAG: hypothetical protein CM1200mP13_03750 [Pelagibacterales bacterium]
MHLRFFDAKRKNNYSLWGVGGKFWDSKYDGTIFVGGEIGSYGSDAVDAELTKRIKIG